MGAGTLVELIARGKQDVYIIGNPQFSFFKSVYRRHTNFATEPIRQIFTESPDFGKRVTCIIDKKGDLLSDLLLEIELPALQQYVSWTNGIGNFMIDFVELQLGGETVDRISGEMMDIWMEMTTQIGVKGAVYSMVGKFVTFNNDTQTGAVKMLVPLPFWFCRNVERALPLISMQYTDVKINIQFKNFDQCWFKTALASPSTSPSITKANIIANYIYLDVFERTKFAKQKNFDYLIEQFQESPSLQVPAGIINTNQPIFFNHPVKELFWTYRSSIATQANDYYNYGNINNYQTPNQTIVEPFKEAQLRVNGNDRFEMMPETYFRLYQPYRYHSSGTSQYIYNFCFAVDPENMQPSGTCNFSKIDNAVLNFVCTPNIPIGTIIVYGTNYNILRIQNGMAGVMFSS